MKTTDTYPISESEATAEINRLYNNGGAWSAGIRSWHSGGVQPIAVTFIESPRTPGAFRSVDYGSDESYRLPRWNS